MKYKLDENRIKEGVGGQAVIEGIMLRNKTHYVVAVRKPNKIIDFIKYSIPENKNKLSKMIFFRGIINCRYDEIRIQNFNVFCKYRGFGRRS